LALFLEDSKRRIQRRLTKMLGVHKREWPQRLTYATQWPRGAEAITLMREWIGKVEKPRLIIIDVLQRIRPRTGDKSKETQYAADYEAMAALQRLTTEFSGLAILVLHHQRKMDAEDLFDTMSGTLGLGGGMDTGLILGTENGQKFLYGRGRDVEEFAFNVKQNEVMRWQNLGPKREHQAASPERAQILAALEETGTAMTVGEVAKVVGATSAQDEKNVSRLLAKLRTEDAVIWAGWGKYQAKPV
jgi:AAA domain